jgi:hypothetical protein
MLVARTLDFKPYICFMSSAFVREGDQQELSDISPTIHALVALLTHENGGIRVYERKRFEDTEGRTIYEMSNGLQYRVNKDNRWEICT